MDVDVDELLVKRTTRAVLERLAGAGLAADPEDSLMAVVDRLVDRDGADQVAKSLRELADEITNQEETDDADEDT